MPRNNVRLPPPAPGKREDALFSSKTLENFKKFRPFLFQEGISEFFNQRRRDFPDWENRWWKRNRKKKQMEAKDLFSSSSNDPV